ncbi:hypothetical protein FACS189421_07240 [Bacteroidia bacterium]|nr:hypothetical protein FACS189421_07240 [Bacteroidia bacterium]GHT03274.1 hypothetical protein FACS189423_03800 [Bacteroidia bacterium]GHT45564.1 hypothetical protein FACS189440_01780 [Bacteroidia bacterium]
MENKLVYDTNTPILFLIFNRPETSRQVFSQIKKVKPQRLYIATDGPRSPEEKIKCEETRKIVFEIDWECSVETLFPEENVGRGKAISQAISWFFEQESEGIVLEEDCLPSDSFFGFCSALLEKYRDDDRIGHISGGNYQKGIVRGDGSYYFSALTHVWGWAGWRRVWKDYDLEINTLPVFDKLNYLEKMPVHGPFKNYWKQQLYFHYQYKEQKHFWTFPYAYHNLINNRLSIIPNVNLISIIGYSTKNNPTNYFPNHPFAYIPLGELKELRHPSFVLNDIVADLYSQSIELNKPVPSSLNSDYFFLKEKLLKIPAEVYPLKIPRIIHQIYEDPSGPPEHLITVSETWKTCHPHWEYRFWNKQAIEDFLESVFPDFIPCYYAFPFDVQRWDAIRYLILYHFGGLYADMDYECLEPLDALLNDSICCMGMEPEENAITHHRDMIIGNALMASVPGHPYFKMIIDDMRQNDIHITHKATQIMETTGPFMVTRIYKNYPEKSEITLLPAELIAPLTLEEVRKIMSEQETQSLEDKVEKAFAIHYFFGSWMPQTI